MMITKDNRHHRHKVYLLGLFLCALSANAVENTSLSNSTQDETPFVTLGTKDASQTSERYIEPLTLKTDPLTGQVHFNTKTVDISILNRQKDIENAEKVAIVQKDLQSRIKVTEENPERPTTENIKEISTEDPAEILRRQIKIKEDLESRIVVDAEDKRYRADSEEYYEDYKNPIERADVEYYEEEPMGPEDRPINLPQRMTTAAPKEEESFLSIFESLFGSGDEESQSKKNQAEEKQSQDVNLKDNIKTVGEILKPIRTHEELQVKSSYGDYEEPQEYRIINQYPQKQGFRPIEQRPYHYSYQQRPNSVKPYQPYRPHPTPGYEDYDLEEFADKSEEKFKPEKMTSPKVTPVSTTTTTTTTTTKSFFNTNRPKFPIADKKSDYVGKTSPAPTTEKATEKGTYFNVKPTTEKEIQKKDYETKVNEVKPDKIQDSANFYNLINLPVRYSNKDTAIPLISTSYANTKIQGMGANKYKTSSGKYPNHKYDPISSTRTTSTTRRPSYWSGRRTTQAPVTPSRSNSTVITTSTRITTSTTRRPTERTDFGNVDYDDLAIGSSANFGGYGSKAGATKITESKVPYFKVKETTTRRVYETQKTKDVIQQDVKVYMERDSTTVRTTDRSTPKPIKETYVNEYEYDSFPAVVQEVKPPKESNIRLHSSYSEKNKLYDSTLQLHSETEYKKTPIKTTTTTEQTKIEQPDYEYYDYETESPPMISSTTTTTPKYRVKYPSLSKDKIHTTSEKVAVVVPSNNQDYYIDDIRDTTSTTSAVPKSTTTTTTTKPTTTTTTHEPIQSQETSNSFKGTYTHFYRPKEPAPVFEENDEFDDYTPRPIIHVTKRTTTERPTTPVKPIIVTAMKKEQENNVNIVLVPMKEPQKETQMAEEMSRPKTEQPSTVSYKTYSKPNDVYYQNSDYTTEFTVGAVHGHGGSVPVQGHFVATSISANPYEDDEPFRPIPKPPGLSTSFQVVADQDDLRKPPMALQTSQSPNRPSQHINFEDSEPIHEPHEFIPSPQFHRPGEIKPSNTAQTSGSGISIDYDFDGIQTEPKPGQYVIFSKPQLNPEMNEGQLKKKPEIVTSPKVPTVTHYHETKNKIGSEGHKPSLYNSKPGQFYTSIPEIKTTSSEKPDQKRPNYPLAPELIDERLSLQLVPPKGIQTEKPFEGNFVTPDYEKAENAASYPRPHWEKNGKPGFLLNSLASAKNEMNANRPLPVPPQMAPTLIPPSSAIPPRFRKPPPPHMPSIRKNFNEGSINIKPKPNLPNILPQFRPNAKIGTGPYQRPFHRPQGGYINPNRRSGPNRYHEKEGNFPYHIHHPAEKEAILHRDFEVEADIYPKFITNRGKIPSELLDPHVMHKRYGDGPTNVQTRRPPPGMNNPALLRRLQRTPVTTLQMLQQTPGMRTHKNPVLREDSEDPSVPMVPPVYQPYKDTPSTEKSVHLVYPSNTHKSRYPIINENEQFDTFNYEFTKPKVQYPLLNPNRRTTQDKAKPPDFPYGFVKPDDKLKLIRKNPEGNGMTVKKNVKVSDEREIKPNLQDYMPTVTKKPTPSAEEKDEKIDMNLHMQSNNQWNKVNAPEEDLIIITQSPLDSLKSTDSYGKRNDGNRKEGEGNQLRINPPSEYHTSIKDGNNSAFTLGAVMHTVPEGKKKGQVTSVSLGDDLTIRNLDVNQRIANGKIVTVSMPLDVKEDSKEKHYNFQAPFQASSSISNGAEPTNQGWSIVKNEGQSESEEGEKSEVGSNRNSTKFSFENFKPELIGGFKPLYEIPEEESVPKKDQKDREEKR